MEFQVPYYQGNNNGVFTAVFFYVMVLNGLYRWLEERKDEKPFKLDFILNVFYITEILATMYFLEKLNVFTCSQDILGIGMTGFYLKCSGMLESFILMLSRKGNVDPIHIMDYCVVVTLATIFAYGNSKINFTHFINLNTFFFVVSVTYGMFLLKFHSILKIIEYFHKIVFGPEESDIIGKLIYMVKVILNFLIMQQMIYHVIGWNVLSNIYFAPAFGHIWFEIKKYYNVSL